MDGTTGSANEELRIVIQRVSRRIRANREREDISDTQLGVLSELMYQGDRTPSQLAQREHVTPPSMNRTLNGLETAGYVTRAPSDDDARKVRVSITENGRALMVETRRLRDEWFSQQLEQLAPEERSALEAVTPILRRISEADPR